MGMISACYSTPYETAAKVQNNYEIRMMNDEKKFAKQLILLDKIFKKKAIINLYKVLQQKIIDLKNT